MKKETAMRILGILRKSEKDVLVCERGVEGRNPKTDFDLEAMDKLYGPIAQGYVEDRFREDVLGKGK